MSLHEYDIDDIADFLRACGFIVFHDTDIDKLDIDDFMTLESLLKQIPGT